MQQFNMPCQASKHDMGNARNMHLPFVQTANLFEEIHFRRTNIVTTERFCQVMTKSSAKHLSDTLQHSA